MKFRLVYEGALHSSGTPTEKHAIRKQLHGQLREFWAQHELLRFVSRDTVYGLPAPKKFYPGVGLKQIGEHYALGGFEFVPLVSSLYRLVYSLDILFLRRENPGTVVSGGDVDNRLKTLFDGLSVPTKDQVVGGPEADERPMFCLLENDRLITEMRVTTDRLLRPVGQGHSPSEVLLIISVELEQTSRLW